MKVYALVGKSGTGKSYQAINLCKEFNIETVVDDGLLIGGTGILAGISAKRETTKVGAIKTALFTKEEHRAAVCQKIKEIEPENILILGTSEGMVEIIAERLELPYISRKIYIEEITTANQREIAQQQRKELGKHVIPAPTFQLKRDFSGYFMHPLRIFKERGEKETFVERSEVRPTYSYLGNFTISDKVVTDIVHCVTAQTSKVSEVLNVTGKLRDNVMKVTVTLTMEYGFNVIWAAEQLQNQIAWRLEEMTAFTVDEVNIEIRGIK